MKFSKEEQFKKKAYAVGKIVEHALQLARLRCFGSHINADGVIERLGTDDVNMYIEGYGVQLNSESQLLLELMARDGVPEVGAPGEDVSCKT